MRIAIERELQQAILSPIPAAYRGMIPMVWYHMGWEADGSAHETHGKRIRPLLLLLTTMAAGGNWQKALPAAAAVELIHNFSLIHDDIQDQSKMRRGRETVWIKWGMAQAINAGDLLFTLAFLALQKLQEAASPIICSEAFQIFTEACILLTGGQYLDLTFETQQLTSIENYWSMVSGKTAALIACCCKLGALIAEAKPDDRDNFSEFGFKLGLAFQAQDDYLGIWGDETLLGKSTQSDLVTGKKTLPVLFACQKRGRFASRWLKGGISSDEIGLLAKWLEEEGAKSYTQEVVLRLTSEARVALDRVSIDDFRKEELKQISERLIHRAF